VDEKVHISVKGKSQCKRRLQMLTLELFQEIGVYMRKLFKPGVIKFEVEYLTEILWMVVKKIDKHNTESDEFNILDTYKAAVLVHVCRFVTCQFQTLNKQYDEKHSPRDEIEKFKCKTWKCFLI